MFMTEDLDLIEERHSIIIMYKALLITDDPSVFHSACRGKTRRIDLQVLKSYVYDNDVILLNIRSRKLRSYVKNFISSHLFSLYIHLTNNIDVSDLSPRNILKQLNINIRDIDSPPKDLLQDSLLILIQRDEDKLVVKECDDRLIRINL